MSAGYHAFVDENIRLIILRALGEVDNASLNDSLLAHELERFGYSKTREYLRNQMRWLETEVGAVRTMAPGTALVATLTKAGRDHLEKRRYLEGIQRPGDLD